MASAQQPAATSAVPKPIQQPIPFSHKKHSDVGLPCQTCHKLEAKGEREQVPTAPDCMACHETIKTDSPAIQVTAKYAKDGAAIPWARIYTVPDFVLFSHKTHLDAKLKCEECHGPVSSSDVLAKEKDFTMKTCIGCHRAHKAQTGCDVCHKLSM